MKGYKKGCPECFELNREKSDEEMQRELDEADVSYMGSYDGWND
jgi:hypothetical protein